MPTRSLMIIFMLSLFLFLVPAGAWANEYGVIIVVDGKDPEMNEKAEVMKTVVMRIRELNKNFVKGKRPLVKTYDLSEPSHKEFVDKVLRISNMRIPIIGLAKLNKDGSFNSFESLAIQSDVTKPYDAAEQTMRRFASYLPADVKNKYRWRPRTGYKSIETIPPGADVYIDDRLVGNTETPITHYPVAPGEHHLKIVMPGYLPLDETIVAPYGSYAFLKRELTPGTVKPNNDKKPLPSIPQPAPMPPKQ